MICAICGKIIENENVSRDHVFPRAIWKWQEEYLDAETFRELKRSIESSNNIVKTHSRCNTEKQDGLRDICSLHVNEKDLSRLELVQAQVVPYIGAFEERKRKVAERQNNCCYYCKRPLSDIRVIRRINKKQPRTDENACIVCFDCNVLIN